MARVQRTALSRRDLLEILLYLRPRSRLGARRVRRAVYETLSFLSDYPTFGRRRTELADEVRSYPVNRFHHYLIFYKVIADGIEVSRIIHGARDLPKQFRRS